MKIGSFTLSKMQNDAQGRLSGAGEKVVKLEDSLKQRMGKKTRGTLIGGIIVTLLWTVLYIIVYAFCREFALHAIFSLLAIASSVLLVLFVLIGSFVELSYYGTILSAQSKLAKLRGRVESAKRNLHGNYNNYMQRERSGWEMPLQAGQPVEEEVRQLEKQLSGLESVRSGFVNGVKNALYYIATVAWTVMGSGFVFELVYPLVESDVEEKTARIICYIAIALACVGAVLVAKLIWGKTDCSVKNITLLGTLNGPVIFAALALVAILVVLAVQLIIAAAGVIIAAVIAISCCCGG